MPENARVPRLSGLVTGLVGFLFALGRAGPFAVLLMWIAGLLVVVGTIAWGVWLALDQWERDCMEGRWSRITGEVTSRSTDRRTAHPPDRRRSHTMVGGPTTLLRPQTAVASRPDPCEGPPS